MRLILLFVFAFVLGGCNRPSATEAPTTSSDLNQGSNTPSQEEKVIKSFVEEYEKDPQRYDREAEELERTLESVLAEAAEMRHRHGISKQEWDDAVRNLSRGRPLSEPFYNSHVLEYILRSRS